MANYYVTSGNDPIPAEYSDYLIIDTTSYDASSATTGYVVSVSSDSNVVIAGDVDDDVIIRTTGLNLTDYNVTTTILDDTTGAAAGSYDLLINAGIEGDVIPTLIVDGDASKFDATISDSASGTSTVTVNSGGSLNSYTGYGDADNITIYGTIGDITTGGGADTIVVDGGTVGGDISTGGGADSVIVQDSSVGGNIFTGGDDDDLELNNANIGGYVDQGGGDDSLVLAGTVNIDGVQSSPTGITYVDASIDQYSGDDTITIMGDTVLTTAGVINQGASSGVGVNEDTLIFDDQGDIDAYTTTLGEADFYDPDGDGTYTYQYNDDLGDKPLGSATGSEGEFVYSGTAFINVDNTNAGWPCFTRGTMIETARGTRPVESLEVGDLILTRDNGLQPIRWIGSKELAASALEANENLRPIRIRRHSLGNNTPENDLLVSPQHRILVASQIAQRIFDEDEVLVAAKQLMSIEGIEIAEDIAEVEYFHILFDRHQIIVSNGAETETLFTGPEALKSIGIAAREEIFSLFPELKQAGYQPKSARPLATGRQGRQLAMRHAKNHKPLVGTAA